MSTGMSEEIRVLRKMADEFFEDNPSERDGVLKAFYAYHAPHFRIDPKSHYFLGELREAECQWCGRRREDVRHDDFPAPCLARPDLKGVDETIYSEEERAFELLDKAEAEVKRLVLRMGVSGETLAILHHTHGYDPETVASIIDFPEDILAEYHTRMEIERDRSRGGQKKIDVMMRASHE